MKLIMGVVVKWLEIWLSQTIHWFGCRFSPLVIQISSLPEKNLPRDENVKAFVVHVTSLSLNLMPIHPAQEAQIALLVVEEIQILALDQYVEAFVMHVTFLLTMPIHSAQEAQIALLVAEKVKILTKYSDFSDVFLEERALILLETTNLNQPCQRLYLAFKVTRWCSYPLYQKARRLFTPNMAISNIKWCRLDYLMH